MIWVVNKIPGFKGVFGYLKKLLVAFTFYHILDQLVVIVSNSPLNIQVGQVQPLACMGCTTAEIFGKGLSHY